VSINPLIKKTNKHFTTNILVSSNWTHCFIFLQIISWEWWHYQFRLMVWVCVPQHDHHVDDSLALSSVRFHGIQVWYLITLLDFTFAFNIPFMRLFVHICSIRKTWGCGVVKSEKDIAAYNVIREQHLLLGPMCFGELSVLALFSLLVALWFSRDPGFVAGWATQTFNTEAEYDLDHLFMANLSFLEVTNHVWYPSKINVNDLSHFSQTKLKIDYLIFIQNYIIWY